MIHPKQATENIVASLDVDFSYVTTQPTAPIIKASGQKCTISIPYKSSSDMSEAAVIKADDAMLVVRRGGRANAIRMRENVEVAFAPVKKFLNSALTGIDS